MADEEVGRLELGVGETCADFTDDANFEISDFGFAICGCGEAATVGVGEKPIFKDVCAAGEICGGVGGEGFNFSGKFGSAGAEISDCWNFGLCALCDSVAKFAFDGSE